MLLNIYKGQIYLRYMYIYFFSRLHVADQSDRIVAVQSDQQRYTSDYVAHNLIQQFSVRPQYGSSCMCLTESNSICWPVHEVQLKRLNSQLDWD